MEVNLDELRQTNLIKKVNLQAFNYMKVDFKCHISTGHFRFETLQFSEINTKVMPMQTNQKKLAHFDLPKN